MSDCKFTDYTPTNISYMVGDDGETWKIANPSPDAAVPNFTAHHPNGTILTSAFITDLESKVQTYNGNQ
jgi:hypothetical protein